MGSDTDRPLQAWTCAKCGAALPAEAGMGELVTCGYCGTPFKLPAEQTRSGGVSISGGSVTIGGDVIGGSVVKIVPRSPAVDAEPIVAEQLQMEFVLDSVVEEKTVAPNIVAPPATLIESVNTPVPAPKVGWRERIKHLFSN